MNKISVIIVDDHKILRDGLKLILNDMGYVDIIGEASNGQEFLEILDIQKPDLVIMDINMPIMNGVEATKKAMAKYPDLKVLVLSMYGDENYYNTMISLGVQGFILKESDYNELERAISALISNNHYFSQQLLLNIIRKKDDNNSAVKLTQRESQVLKLICQGFSNAEIADKLFLSVRTVEKHRAELLARTSSPNSVSLVMYAVRNRLVEI
jgi:DNA-binding NarL/FixJ family response regulator